MLSNIERVTKQRIEIVPVPTVADLRARRQDVIRAGLREVILAGDLDAFSRDRRAARRGVRSARRRGGRLEAERSAPGPRRDGDSRGPRTSGAGRATARAAAGATEGVPPQAERAHDGDRDRRRLEHAAHSGRSRGRHGQRGRRESAGHWHHSHRRALRGRRRGVRHRRRRRGGVAEGAHQRQAPDRAPRVCGAVSRRPAGVPRVLRVT